MEKPGIFNYNLPVNRIASRPVELRDVTASRDLAKLLYARARTNSPCEIQDLIFSDLTALLSPGDLLILNNTRVTACRFFVSHQGREMEIFLVNKLSEEPGQVTYTALAKPMRRLKLGQEIKLSPDLVAKVLGRTEDQRQIIVQLSSLNPLRSVAACIDEVAAMPIPTYIRAIS